MLNNKDFIKEAIESVLSQDYSDIEYIVIDGGSTDGSLEIIKSYGSAISVLISEVDSGIYDAMNKGIALATGDIIGFLNSDDFYANNQVLTDIVNHFKQDTDAVYADLDYISRHNRNKIIRKWRSGSFSEQKFYYGWMPPHPTFFVRSSIYKKFGGYNTQLTYSGDYELMLRLCLLHQIRLAYIPIVLIIMRIGGHGNRSLKNRINANLEDRKAWRFVGLKPFPFTLLLKPLRKIAQYFI